MVFDVKVVVGGGAEIYVPITGMEETFPEVDGTEKGQLNPSNIDERFEHPWQAIVAHRHLNEASRKARKEFWGHENKAVIRSFIKEFDEKGGFLEYTQRQRWTLGGYYSICMRYLFDIELQQFYMSRFYSVRTKVLGRKWALPDRENLRRFSTYIAEAPPTSDLKPYQLSSKQ